MLVNGIAMIGDAHSFVKAKKGKEPMMLHTSNFELEVLELSDENNQDIQTSHSSLQAPTLDT